MELSVCRFCLKSEELDGIFELPDKLAQLQVQILSVTGQEVFEGDGGPAYICALCRKLVEVMQQFKQNCKKSEVALKQYFMTQKLPAPFVVPLEGLSRLLGGRSEKSDKEVSTDQVVLVDVATQVEPAAVATQVEPAKVATQVKPAKVAASSQPKPVKRPVKTIEARKPKKEKPVEAQIIFDVEEAELIPPPPPPPLPQRIEDEVIQTIEEDGVQFKILSVPPRKRIKREKKPHHSSEPLLLNQGVSEFVPKLESLRIKHMQVSGEEDVVTMQIVESSVPIVFACSYCERSYPLRQQLEIHETNHFRERTFGCDICENKFFSKHDLSKHMTTHATEKPWKCVVCDRSFSRSNILKRHEQTHQDELRYQCGACSKKFIGEAALDAHLMDEHGHDRRFKCEICNK